MGKKVLKADTVVKNYWRNNEQFADIFNAVLFNGNKVIKPEELEDMDYDDFDFSEPEDEETFRMQNEIIDKQMEEKEIPFISWAISVL